MPDVPTRGSSSGRGWVCFIVVGLIVLAAFLRSTSQRRARAVELDRAAAVRERHRFGDPAGGGGGVAVRSLDCERRPSTDGRDDKLFVSAEVAPGGQQRVRVVARLRYPRLGPDRAQVLSEEEAFAADDDADADRPLHFHWNADLSVGSPAAEPSGVEVLVYGDDGSTVLARKFAALARQPSSRR